MLTSFHLGPGRSKLKIRTDPDRVVVRGPHRFDLSEEAAFRLADLLVDHAEHLEEVAE